MNAATNDLPVDRRTARISVVVGGGRPPDPGRRDAFAVVTPPAYTAEAMAVVLPGRGSTKPPRRRQCETLSRGPDPRHVRRSGRGSRASSTAAAVPEAEQANARAQTKVEERRPEHVGDLGPDDRRDPAVAEQMADATTTLASKYLAGLSKPYRTELVHTAEGSAFSSGTSPTTLLVLAVIVALVAGVAIQQAVYHLLVAMRKSRGREPGTGSPR